MDHRGSIPASGRKYWWLQSFPRREQPRLKGSGFGALLLGGLVLGRVKRRLKG